MFAGASGKMLPGVRQAGAEQRASAAANGNTAHLARPLQTAAVMNLSAFSGLDPFIDPLAIAIVGGGTALAVALRTPSGDLVRALAALRVLPRSTFSADPLLEQIAALTRIARRHGVIALDRTVVRDADVAEAVAGIVDGLPPEAIGTRLRYRRQDRYERHRAAGETWAAAAETAPAMGMVGTLIGLVAMFSAMRDPHAIGGAMAVALLATLYGALLGNLVALPVASRLKRHARAEAQERARIEAPLEALAALEPGIPRVRVEMEAAA
jgi:chemotaxis protein MotA